MWHQRKQIILLTCDAVGVQLPISKLAPNQVRYHFISGYTAKVAGSEEGVKETVLTDTLSQSISCYWSSRACCAHKAG